MERWLSWSKALDSKSSVPLNSGTVGSNPTLSASWKKKGLDKSEIIMAQLYKTLHEIQGGII
jgi:hypothetical protein